ncbi:MAG: hypothetical protein M3142_00825, partial [Bacteroidota bacterium]|nr:hypothetical protein [Bacteroidota bacterium]
MNLKSMPEEEELDNMFRQAADSFQPEFDPEAWREMEKKLDEVNRPKPALATWMKRSVIVLLLLVSGWLVYHFAINKNKRTGTEENKIKVEYPVSYNKKEVTLNSESATVEKQKDLDKHHLSNSLESIPGSAALSANEKGSSKSTQLPDQTNRVSTRQPALVKSGTVQKKENRVIGLTGALNNSEEKSVIKNNTNNSGKPEATGLSSNGKEQKADSVASIVKPLNTNQNVGVESVQQDSEQMAQNKKPLLDSAPPQAVADSATRKTGKWVINKFGITLVLGPDFSTVNFVKPEKASTNIGVLLSYRFS